MKFKVSGVAKIYSDLLDEYIYKLNEYFINKVNDIIVIAGNFINLFLDLVT